MQLNERTIGVFSWCAFCAAIALSTSAIAKPDGASPAQSPILKFIDEHHVEHDLTQSDISALARTTVKVTDHDGKPAEYEGVPLGTLLESQGVKLGKALRGDRAASYLLFEAKDGYHVVLALAEADPTTSGKVVLLADKKDGQPLPKNEGPWRLILPDEKRPVRWIRLITQISLESAIAPPAKPKRARD
jgi:hypothetical protein